MIFSPDDYGTNLVVAAHGIAPAMTRLMIWALSTGEESPQEMLEETRRLLHSVDAAMTVALNKLNGDEDLNRVATHWAFFSRGIFNQLERLSKLDGFRNEDLAILIGANTFLMARKLTFELNGVDVPLVVPA